jgi:hypothetical protein
MGENDADSFTIENRAKISQAVETAVEWAFANGLEEVDVFEVEELDVVFSLKREEFETALNGCIDYYLSVEEYELCETINKLKLKL